MMSNARSKTSACRQLSFPFALTRLPSFKIAAIVSNSDLPHPEPARSDSAKTESNSDNAARWEKAYELGKAPWDVPAAQPAIIEAWKQGLIESPVIDVGCGTGENAMYLAEQGLEVVGIDFSSRAIELANQKAKLRHVNHPITGRLEFHLLDAFRAESLAMTFQTVIDSGLFHFFQGEFQAQYVQVLRRLLRPEGRLIALCFSEQEPGDYGPPRLSREQVERAFRDGWIIEQLQRTRFAVVERETGPNFSAGGAHAWRIVARRNEHIQ
jgi:SAM-dependent methyltransferase